MNIRESSILALRAMRAAPLRSMMTMFGLAVGVAAVIMLVGLGQGIQTGFSRSLSSFSTSLFVFPSAITTPGGNGARVLRDRDARALTDVSRAPDVTSVVPMIQGSSIVRHDGLQFSARVAASNENYLNVFNQRIGAGRMFTPAENADQVKVCLIGPQLVNFLFSGDAEAALDSDVQIGRATFHVIGLVAPTPDSDDVVIMPLEAARNSIYANNDKLAQIGVQVAGPDRVEPAVAQVKAILDRQHFIRDPGVRDFTVSATLTQMRKTTDFLDLLTRFTLGVAAIALFVGGLGVANIMLVTVSERTHEIGILKAIGARRKAVVRQFLVESTILSGVGGLFGAILGVALTLAAARLLPVYLPDVGAPELSWPSVGLAFAVSLAIGVLAGVYPAFRGASLRPVDALGY
jgi:putative ABC transport system permease protein